jgi:RNA polymerase sigma-32 factor
MNSVQLSGNLATIPPLSNIAAYSRAVQSIETLSAEDEKRLAFAVFENNDSDSAWILAHAHLRLPVKVAKDHRGYGLPEEDLIQEGNIGLLKAIKKFDPRRGVRLSVVALYWIEASVRAYVMKNWRIVKVATTKALRKLFFSYKNTRAEYQALGHSGEDLDQLIADKLNVSKSELHDFEQRILGEVSLDQPLLNDDTESTFGDLLEAPTQQDAMSEILEKEEKSSLDVAMSSLPSRTQEILKARYFSDPPEPLHLLSEKLGVSVGRIHQIEKQGLAILRKNFV